MIVWRERDANTGSSWVTLGLIAANVLVYLVMNLAREGEGLVNYGVTPSFFRPVTLLTAPFLHAGLLHLAGNMYFLWIFGREVEFAIGRGIYLGAYLIFGLVAGMVDLLARFGSSIPAIGASGAISGVMAMYGAIYPAKRFKFFFVRGIQSISAIGLIILFLSLDLLGALLSVGRETGGVAHFAHLGGTLMGLLVGFTFRAANIVEIAPAQAFRPSAPLSSGPRPATLASSLGQPAQKLEPQSPKKYRA